MPPRLSAFSNRREASEAAARLAADALHVAIAERGAAVLMVSGGSSPVTMFEHLCGLPVDWQHVTTGLVDERWVDSDHPQSNERLVRTHLLHHAAAEANFVPMKTAHASAADAVSDRNAAYAPLCGAMSFVLLGMGEDGHTASWFPGAHNLADVVSAAQPNAVAAVEAPGAAVAQRMTLTGSAVARARQGVLLIFGETKRHIILSSDAADPVDCPVRFALDSLGNRLSIYWAP